MAGNRETRRERAGKGASVGGSPASDALQALVAQFSERTSFVRELIQNALDAGAGRVDVVVTQEARALRIDVIDDGEGMDREIIEGYLLTLFRSTKEEDLTKIGKFGVGFVSLFAVEPKLVTVDTARDGVHHRVVFDADYRYTLAEMEEPFEGTRVSLWVKTWGKPAGELAKAIREAAHYWCRYARAEVTVQGKGAKWKWPLETVAYEFTVDAPVVVQEQADGFRAVLGLSTDPTPRVGYYNRGLTLLEANEDIIPGVTFRVEAKALEHTLTRDNVIRNANYMRIIDRLRKVARTRLREAHLEALCAPEATGDPQRYRKLLLAAHNSGIDLPDNLPILRTIRGSRVSTAALGLGLLGHMRKTDTVFWAERVSPVTASLESQGQIVLLGPPDEQPEVDIVRAIHTGFDSQQDANALYICPTKAPSHPLLDAVQQVKTSAARRYTWHAGQFDPLGQRGTRFSVIQDTPFVATRLTEMEGVHMVINTAHPLFERLAALPTHIAAPLLIWMAQRDMEDPDIHMTDVPSLVRTAMKAHAP